MLPPFSAIFLKTVLWSQVFILAESVITSAGAPNSFASSVRASRLLSMSSRKSRSEIDCFQLRPVPFAFCSSILVTSTCDIDLGAAGTGAGASFTATSSFCLRSATLGVVLTPFSEVGALPLGLAAGAGFAVEGGLEVVEVGLGDLTPVVPVVAVCSCSLRRPNFSRILLNILIGNPFAYLIYRCGGVMKLSMNPFHRQIHYRLVILLNVSREIPYARFRCSHC